MNLLPSGLVAQDYTLTGRSWAWAAIAGIWTISCDVLLKGASRAATCDASSILSALQEPWSTPDGCESVQLAGPFALETQAHGGALFGIARDGLQPVIGQVLGLALLAVAAVASVLVLRWKRRASGDPSALALMWAGALASAAPRLIGATALSELDIAGIPTGIAEFAFAFGALWLLIRLVGELARPDRG